MDRKICFAIEVKNDDGDLTAMWISTDGCGLFSGPWSTAIKFYDRDSAERFRMVAGKKKWSYPLKNLEVTEHEESDLPDKKASDFLENER
jgi:hypothetical protein